MPQFGASLTDDSRNIIYGRNMFIVQATGLVGHQQAFCHCHGHGQTLANKPKPGPVFNSRSGCVHAMYLHVFETKLPNLKLKTWHKQLLGSLPLDIELTSIA
jgi:hypothetical protein